MQFGFNPALIDALAPLFGADSSAVLQVRDAQYGGILGTRASVLVVVDQWQLMPDGSIKAGGTTADVRLTKASPHWRVVEALPARPGTPTSRPSDHPLGRAVDVWALDSKPLVIPANHMLATSAMRLASAHDAYNVGGLFYLVDRSISAT